MIVTIPVKLAWLSVGLEARIQTTDDDVAKAMKQTDCIKFPDYTIEVIDTYTHQQVMIQTLPPGMQAQLNEAVSEALTRLVTT